MTNATMTGNKKIAPSAIYEEGAVVFPVLHGLWEKMALFKDSLKF